MGAIYNGHFYALFASVVLFLVCLAMIAITLSFMQLVGSYSWTDIVLIIGLIFLAIICLVCIVIATKRVVHTIQRRNVPRTEGSSVQEEPDIIKRLIYYASGDAAFAERVFADLQSRRIPCILVQSGTLGEEEKHPLIFMRGYDQLLLVLSGQTRSNAWTERLVNTALRLEMLRGRTALFLLNVEATTGKDTGIWSTTRFRSHKREDFTGWKDPELYEQALYRLVADLREAMAVS